MPTTKNTKKPASKPKTGPKKAESQLNPDKWLLAALPFAADSGWNAGILMQAARKLNCDPALSKVVFPSGIRGLARHFNAWANQQMESAIVRHAGFRHMKVRQKVAFGVRARLEALAPYQGAIRQLLKWAAVPTNAPIAVKGLAETCSAIWYAAGDTSTDYNYYTKRGLLMGVYSSTLLFWLNDSSKNKEATWAFLDARIDDVMQVGQKIGQLKQMGSLADKFMKMRDGLKRAA